MSKKVAVSVFSREDIERDILRLNETDVDYIHIDVADGDFVKRKAMPFKILSKLSGKNKKRLDVHLMANNPVKLIEEYASLNTEYITIHCELSQDVDNLLNLIKSYGIKSGLAIKPDTDINILDSFLNKIDLILVMSVEPGLSGQAFNDDAIDKAIQIKKKVLASKRDIKISMDGGINDEIAEDLSFIDIIISESYVFSGDNIQERIDKLRA